MNNDILPYITELIPTRKGANGVITKKRLRRSAKVYLGLVFFSLLLVFASSSLSIKAFGLGLIIPGGGFLLYASGDVFALFSHISLFLLSLVLMFVALFAWFGSGNILAPIVVWLGTAVWAATMSHHHIWESAVFAVPIGVAVVFFLVFVMQKKALAKAIVLRDVRNRYLAKAKAIATPVMPVENKNSVLPVVEELSAEALAELRFVLDRALQPINEFNGFKWIEQFQTSSVRYQVMQMGYALSLAQYCRTPSFRGYMSQAQRNLIEKTKDHRMWSYWAYENAWGNLRFDADPMAPKTHDNVMYSGWYAAQIAMYASNTGDYRYNEKGAITLTHPKGQQYVYDLQMVTDLLTENFKRSEFCLFPCEPNWIYLMCNNFAGIGLSINDRLMKKTDWQGISQDYRDNLNNEFLTVDGRIVAIRSTRTGFTVPALTSTMADASSALFLHALVPEVARRSWEIVRQELVKVTLDGVKVEMRGWDNIDTGSYKKSTATTLSSLMAAATEMGDYALASKVRIQFEKEHVKVTDKGVSHFQDVSLTGHLHAITDRVGRVNGLCDLVNKGMPEEWLNGPILDEVEYPKVLVAKAVSDGQSLNLVLYPGEGEGIQSISLAQLKTGKSYLCKLNNESSSEEELLIKFTADHEGVALLDINLVGRTTLNISLELD